MFSCFPFFTSAFFRSVATAKSTLIASYNSNGAKTNVDFFLFAFFFCNPVFHSTLFQRKALSKTN